MTKKSAPDKRPVKHASTPQPQPPGSLAKKIAKANAKSKSSKKVKGKGKSGSWGIKHVLATPYAPTLPPVTKLRPDEPDAIEALRQAYAQLTGNGDGVASHAPGKARARTALDENGQSTHGPGEAQNDSTAVDDEADLTETDPVAGMTNEKESKRRKRNFRIAANVPACRKPYGLLVGVNEVTRALEKCRVSVVAMARDVGTSVLISHLPALCATSGASLVALPDDGSKLGAAIGLRRALVVGISKEKDKPLPLPLKNLTVAWSKVATPLDFPWLPTTNEKNNSGNKQTDKLTFHKPTLIPHRNKAKREVLGIPADSATDEDDK